MMDEKKEITMKEGTPNINAIRTKAADSGFADEAGKQARQLLGLQQGINLPETGKIQSDSAVANGSGAAAVKKNDADERARQQDGRYGFNVRSAREVQNGIYTRQGYIAEGLVTKGLNILAGAPKQGKSLFALNLATVVAGDGNF